MKMVSGNLCPSRRLLAVLWLSFAMFAVAAAAQEATTTATISGTVSSTKGGPIANAKVILTDKNTAKTSAVTTDENGKFTATGLVPSDYALRIEAPHFVTDTVQLAAHAGPAAQVDVQLSPEPIPGVVDVRSIADLPFNGGNFLQGASIQPGMQPYDAGALDSAKSGFQGLSVAGPAGRTKPQIEVDGLTARNESAGSTTQNIPLSAIEEFKSGGVLAHAPDQLDSPGAINFVTRSGGDSLHGELSGTYGNGKVLSASLPGGGNRDWGRQQYGGNAGGAVIPGKLFFFADAQRNKQDLANPVLLGGPFSVIAPSGITINEPFREFETSDRLDYKVSETTRAFYRFTYDQNNDTATLGQGPSLQPYQSKTNTPANAVGVDFNRGSFVNSLRFEYLKFKNVLSQPPGPAVPAFPITTINIGGGATTQCNDGSLFCSGPNPFASQQTQQSNFQFRYDGSRVWNRHNFHVGVGFDHIRAGLFDSRYSIAPALSDQSSTVLPAGVFGSDGNPANPLSYPVQWAFLGNGQGFASEKSAFGMAGGGFGDNQFDIYGGDTWKLKRNITVTYGVHWLRDGGRNDTDLAAIPALNSYGPGLGGKIRQPSMNFAPQLGAAWDPSGEGRTIIHGGAGLFYDASLFQNVALDRPLRLAQGTFNSTPAACVGGAPGEIQWPSAGSPGSAIAGGAGFVNANGTVSPTWCGDSMGSAGPQAVALQTAYQTAIAAAAGTNLNYMGNAGSYAGPYVNGLSLLAPNYQTPRTLQMDVGLQHELWPGLILTADYVRNVTTRNLLGLDVNQGGAENTFNVTNATNDRDAAQTAAGCPIGPGQVGCMVAKLGPAAALSAYGAAGIGGPGQVTGGAPCPFCAFPGIHPNLGVNVMNFPVGRSVYYGELVSLRQQMKSFTRGVRGASFRVSYAHSRYVSQSDDEDLAPMATDYANPDRFTGPGAFDRTHQISVAAHFDLEKSFQLSFISHLLSPLPQTLRLQQNSGGAEVLVTDWNGDGSVGDIVPGTNVGTYMRNYFSASYLQTFITNYNTNVAGRANPQTPAGQQLITAGVFSLPELEEMGGVQQPLAATVADPSGLGWLKTLDIRLGWQHKFGERFTVTPNVALFNALNFANFDLAGNTQSGVLNFGAGSLSRWSTVLQPQGTVGGTSPAGITARTNRASLQSGMNAAGAPRSAVWGLKISF